MGTYVASLTFFSSGGPVNLALPYLDNFAKHGIRFQSSEGANGSVVFEFTGNYISLDGNPAIAFTGLPAGFQFDTINFANGNGGAFTASIGTVQGDANGTTQAIVTWGVHGPITTNSGATGTIVNIVPVGLGTPFACIDMLSTYQIALTLSHVSGGGASENCFVYDNLKANGNYDIYVSISPLSSTVASHTKITLTAPSSLDLLSDTEVISSAGVVIGHGIISNQSATSVDITMPSFGGYSGPAALVGIEFGGRTYILQPMAVVLGDPSGLYVIVPGKTNDTLYVDHTTVTQDVAIPVPFAKTGFVE